jgi:DNA helicase-2/ATP-dependent DNA helicase PcrA
MVELLREDCGRRVSFITFTRTSRRDTCRKLEDCLAAGDSDVELEFPRASTLHGYAKAIVHRYGSAIDRRSDFSILVENKDEKTLVLGEVVDDLGLDLDIPAVSEALSKFRARGEWPQGFLRGPEDRERFLRNLDCLLVLYNAFDLEGLVAAACQILEGRAIDLPPVYLQVDEYQDLNPNDQRLVQLAASHPSSEVVVVGDDAQSIYGFRHAHHEGLRELWDSPDWETVRFHECHRLPGHVLNAAAALVAREGYLGAELTPCPQNDRNILALQCTRPQYQAQAVARQIRDLMSTATTSEGDALRYRDILVLCPTRDLATNMMRRLEGELGIPTREHARSSIPDDHWRLLLVLRILHRNDGLALRQWLPLLGLAPSKITEIRRAAMDSGESFYSFCAGLREPTIVNTFVALERLRNSGGHPERFRRALREFPNLVLEDDFFPQLGLTIDEATQEIRGIGSLIHVIYERFGLIEPESDVAEEDKVLVTTLHSAKGLEAEFVFVTWLNQRYMPMPGRDEREERRLLYVALTRAKQDVVLTFHETFGGRIPRRQLESAMSPFLREIRHNLRVQRVRAADL